MFNKITFFLVTLSLFIGALPLNILGLHVSAIIVPLLLIIYYKEFSTINFKHFSKVYQLFFAVFLIPILLSSFNTLTSPSIGVGDFNALFSPLLLILSISLWKSIVFRHGLEVMVHLYLIFACMIILLGILQFFNVASVTRIIELFEVLNEKTEKYFLYNLRARSIFPSNPNGFAIFCLSVIFLVKFIKNHFLKLSLVSLSIFAIILSGSTAVLCLAIILVIVLNMRWAIILSPLVAMLGYATLWPYLEIIVKRQKLDQSFIPSSFLSRIQGYWLDTWNLILDNPFMGIGPSTERMTFSSDSFYLDFILKNGFIGFGFLSVSILLFLTRNGIKNYTFFYLMFGITASLFRNDQLNFLLSFVFAVTGCNNTCGKDFVRK